MHASMGVCSSSDASMMGTVSLRVRKDGRYEPANATSIVLNTLVYVTSHPRSNMKTSLLLALSAVAGSSVSVSAFVPSTGGQKVSQSYQTQLGIFGKFFEELDAFVDDATNRRLGNGAAFYGKRKSTFYGEQDFMKKDDKDVEDPTEDYQGPKKAGYFQWQQDEDGMMRPVTRLKKKNIERNPNYWDKVFTDDE